MHELGALSGLPTETLLDVFKYLDGRDLARSLRVCKTFKHHIDQSSALRYAIRLSQYGYKDGPHASQDHPFSSPASRLKALEDHINRWTSLDWVEERIKLPRRVYWKELVGGILAFSHRKYITCIQLPSRICQTPLRTWTHKNDFKTFSFTIDPSQDLLVLVDILDSNGTMSLDVHLRTLSGNTPHPRASGILSTRDFPLHRGIAKHAHLGVMGDAVALFEDDDGEGKLLIWSWWTGELICGSLTIECMPLRLLHPDTRTHQDQELQANVEGFLWIGPRTILLPWYSYEESICEESICDGLVLYEVGQGTHLRKMVALELPLDDGPLPGTFYLHGGVHANQTPSGTVPFDSSGLHNIHFHLNSLDYEFWEDTPELVVRAAMLKQYAHKYLHRDDLESTPSISWTDWCPHNTCFICPSRPKPLLCDVRGSRLARVDTSGTLSVLDFTPNLAVVPPDLSQSESPTLGSVRKTESDGRSEPAIDSYESPVVPEGTGLPYHEVKRKLEPSISDPTRIFIDDEHIILFVMNQMVEEDEMTEDEVIEGAVLIVLTL